MTLTLELPAEVEQVLTARAQARGVTLPKYLETVVADLARTPQASTGVGAIAPITTPEPWPGLSELLSFVEALPNHRAQAGLGALGDTSRSAEPDIYGYSEIEDCRR